MLYITVTITLKICLEHYFHASNIRHNTNTSQAFYSFMEK